MARPTKRTEALVGKLEYAFSLGCTVTEACLHADINRDTYYEWCKADPKLSDRMNELRETPIFLARQSVLKGLKDNPELALKFLERRKKDEFSPRAELTGRDGESLGVTISANQAEQLIRARAERTDT